MNVIQKITRSFCQIVDGSLDQLIGLVAATFVSMATDDDLRVVIGSDHAGFQMKQFLIKELLGKHYEVSDEGTDSADSTDYPDYAHAVAQSVADGDADLGIVVCGSGNGVNITANKHVGVRSALAWLPEVAELARQHNNANILALPARYIDENTAIQIVERFLNAEFEGGRHERRVDKIE